MNGKSKKKYSIIKKKILKVVFPIFPIIASSRICCNGSKKDFKLLVLGENFTAALVLIVTVP